MFKPQKACDLKEIKGPLTFPKLASIKLDGIRIATPHGSPLTKSLKRVPNMHIADLLSHPSCANLDGELICGLPNDPETFRRTQSAQSTHEGEPEFIFYVFDILGSDKPFLQRTQELAARTDLPSYVRVLEQRIVHNQDELDAFYAEVTQAGFEGLIIRSLEGLYKFGRSTPLSQDCIKWKPYSDDEAMVLSVYEAMTNNNEAFTNALGHTERSSHQENKEPKGMIGGFECIDLKTRIKFRVTAGKMKHPQRVRVWEEREQWDGKQRFIKYRHFTVGVKEKARHGRFIEIVPINDIDPQLLIGL